MSVNKLLTLINHHCDRRKEENSSLDKSDKYIELSKSYIGAQLDLTQITILRDKTLSSTSRLNQTDEKNVNCSEL